MQIFFLIFFSFTSDFHKINLNFIDLIELNNNNWYSLQFD